MARSRKKQLLVLLLGGFVLAFGGCLLFATQVDSTSSSPVPLFLLGGLVFACGALMFIIGAISVLVIVLTRLFGSSKTPSGEPGAPA